MKNYITKSKKFIYIIAAIFTVILFMCSSYVGSGAQLARAATSASAVVSAYDRRNVLEDLEGSTIDGEPFDLDTYNFDKNKSTQLLSFIEFCYSSDSGNQQDYGLYVYVYNPQGLNYVTNSELNKISLRYGGNKEAGYDKYRLFFLNQSTARGYEGLFYKYKLLLSDTQRRDVLNTLNSSERIYEVGELELKLSDNINAQYYKVGKSYKYSGYAKGYGISNNKESSLVCETTKLTVLTPSVHHTYWRPEGDNGKLQQGDGTSGTFFAKSQDSIHSVYFAVPKTIDERYGEMYAIHAQWLEAVMAPALVTDNLQVYNKLSEYVGAYFGKVRPSELRYHMTGYFKDYNGDNNPDSFNFNYLGYSAYREHDGTYDVFSRLDKSYHVLNYIPYLFLATNGDAASYVVSSSEIDKWVYKNYAAHDNIFNELVYASDNPYDYSTVAREVQAFHDKIPGLEIYSRLFESVADEYNEVNILATDTYPITSRKWSDPSWWWNYKHVEGIDAYDVQAIYQVTDKDFIGTRETISKNLLVAEENYQEFVNFYNANQKDSNIYLFRFAASDYITGHVRIFHNDETWGYRVEDDDTYIFSDSVYLDFDMIDITYKIGNSLIVFPVAMSPQNIFSGGEPPAELQIDTDIPWWVWAIIITAVVAVILIIIAIVYPPAGAFMLNAVKAVFKLIIWLVTLPFKLLARLFPGGDDPPEQTSKKQGNTRKKEK